MLNLQEKFDGRTMTDISPATKCTQRRKTRRNVRQNTDSTKSRFVFLVALLLSSKFQRSDARQREHNNPFRSLWEKLGRNAGQFSLRPVSGGGAKIEKNRQDSSSIVLPSEEYSDPYLDPDKNYEEDVDEMEEHPVGLGIIASFLSNPERLALISVKAIQFSLLWFLAKALAKALSDVVEEFSSADSMGGDPYFVARSDLPRLFHFLDNPSPTSAAGVPRHALQLLKDLAAAGIPNQTPEGSGRSSIRSLFEALTRSEANILQQCLWRPPPHVAEHPGKLWNSVLGLDSVKEHILLTVAAANVSPSGDSSSSGGSLLQKTQHAYSSLLSSGSGGASSAPTTQHHGMLLYGPPGTGKSMLVQALAAKLRWPCLVVTPSVLMRKYVGETNLQVRSLFSLVQNKLAPCIVVLDELDGLFRERHDNEHDSSRELKTEFLQWLSGIMTTSHRGKISDGRDSHPHHKQPLLVIGASNRPFDIDSAVLRRLPQRFFVGFPDFNTRCQLLRRVLKDVPTEKHLLIDLLGQQTEGYTPSDIQQALQTAVVLGPLKEALMSDHNPAHVLSPFASEAQVRPLTTQDLLNALTHVQASPLSPNYRHALEKFANSNGGNIPSYGGTTPPSPGGHFMHMGTVNAFSESTFDITPSAHKDQDFTYDEDIDEDDHDHDEDDSVYDFDDDDL